MTQEEKDLLLKDLCTRLPYGVVVNYDGLARPLFGIEPTQHFQITLDNALDGEHNGLAYVSLDVDGEVPKPYLRPLSSITKKEKDELIDLGLGYIDSGRYEDENGVKIYIGESFQFIPCFELYDWFNSHFFDYRGLIENELALEAPEVMYKHFGDMDVVVTSVEHKDKL